MKCASAGSYLMGVEVTVLIRPERIALAPFDPSSGEATGKVTEALAPGDEVSLTAAGPVAARPEGGC